MYSDRDTDLPTFRESYKYFNVLSRDITCITVLYTLIITVGDAVSVQPDPI